MQPLHNLFLWIQAIFNQRWPMEEYWDSSHNLHWLLSFTNSYKFNIVNSFFFSFFFFFICMSYLVIIFWGENLLFSFHCFECFGHVTETINKWYFIIFLGFISIIYIFLMKIRWKSLISLFSCCLINVHIPSSKKERRQRRKMVYNPNLSINIKSVFYVNM